MITMEAVAVESMLTAMETAATEYRSRFGTDADSVMVATIPTWAEEGLRAALPSLGHWLTERHIALETVPVPVSSDTPTTVEALIYPAGGFQREPAWEVE